MKTDLEAAIRITLINLVVAFNPNTAFRKSAAGVDDGSSTALTSPTMTDIHSFRLSKSDYSKRAAVALRRSLLVTSHHDSPKRRLIPPYARRPCRAHHRGGIRSLAPAAITALSAKTAKHLIEDVRGISECVAFWAGQFFIALTLGAGALRHDPCSFQASR